MNGVLAAKLLLAPGFVVSASLAARRWGAIVGGVVGGLPVVAGPILAILAIENGSAFASRAAAATLLGLISLTGFVLTYALLVRRLAWPLCLAAGWAVFLAITTALELWSARALPALIASFAVFLAVLAVMPREHDGFRQLPPTPAWDLPLRALSAAVLVIVVTGSATALGPQLSGLLAPFPVIATVLAAFTHAQAGPDATLAILRGMLRGFFAFALFCFSVSLALEQISIGAAFALATAIAIVVQGGVLLAISRQ